MARHVYRIAAAAGTVQPFTASSALPPPKRDKGRDKRADS
jgi:hypothetical protein